MFAALFDKTGILAGARYLNEDQIKCPKIVPHWLDSLQRMWWFNLCIKFVD